MYFVAGLITHETYFAPFPAKGEGLKPEHNYIEWGKFIKEVVKVEEISLTFLFDTYNKERRDVICKIKVDEGLKTYLEKFSWGWAQCY